MNQIRVEKFDRILPEAMRENGIDMWITMIREANYGTLYLDFGQGYTGNTGYYIFTDRGGDRIERAALGISGYRIRESGAYDLFQPAEDLADFVRERDPQRIGINTSRTIGPVDNLTYTGYQQLVETLGERYASRLVSGEKLVSDFRSRRTTTEIAAFAEAGEISREIAERAFSNEVITPGVTMLEDVAWWMMDQLLARGLDTSFGLPSVYVTGPDGIESTSNDRIIRRGDLLMIDWGVGFLNMYTDMKRIAYVLRQGEAKAPPSFQRAFDKGREARTIITNTIRPGIAAAQAEQEIYDALTSAGFTRISFNEPTSNPDVTDVVIGSHSVGNSGHGIGPSIAFFNPVRIEYTLQPTNLLSIELFAYTAVPEWNNKKVRIPLEDNAVLTNRGVEWLYPVNGRILLIR
jgi:Xaa-Pro aminopeptidase